MLWKLSPVVGEVVDKQVSIIFQLQDKLHKVYYVINDSTKQHAVENDAQSPTQIHLTFKEDGQYRVSWFINDTLSYKHTIIITNIIHKLITVSCDFLEKDTHPSHWLRVEKELVSNERTVIMHLGDQIYADAVYRECKKLQKKYQRFHLMRNHLVACYYQLYANRYCQTFQPHTDILSNTSNYYLWDDHDIVNDVQYDAKDAICYAATRAYEDYQMSFHVRDTFIINKYCWYKYFQTPDATETNGLILAIERTTQKIPLYDIFTAINQLLIHNIENVILSFSSAVIPAPEGFMGKCYTKKDKFWSKRDLQTLLDYLFNLRLNVILLGGDLHCGIHGFYSKNNKIIPVIVASPITNAPSVDRKWVAQAYCNSKRITISDTIQFRVMTARAERCLGVIDMWDMSTNIVFEFGQ